MVHLCYFGHLLALLVLALLAVVSIDKRGLEMMRIVVYLFRFGRHLLDLFNLHLLVVVMHG